MPVSSQKTFRLFVSSTFADLAAERDALQNRVFPRLRDFCEQHGARFSPVDLRWGVSTDAGQDRRTMAICVEEIRRCQQTTPRPNFIILLGARYGWRPLPAEIAVEDLEQLRSIAPLQRGLPFFERLYPTIDLNAVPPVYCLRPRTGDVDSAWDELERDVLATLASAASELDWPFTKRVIFGGSATEQEIAYGLFSDAVLPAAGEHVHAFLGNPGDDQKPPGPDEDAQRLDALKERLRATLGANAHEYDINANDAAARLDRLCDDVYAALAPTIAQEAERFTRLDPLNREIDAHDAFALERSRIFIGRAAVLNHIERYLSSNDDGQTFALIGPSGSGKSSAMARALTSARRNYPQAAIVSRFIGSTPESSSGVTLLRSLSVQVSRMYGGAPPPAYADYPRMAAVFRDGLKLARPDKPLLLFLDALDQLPALDSARNLSWLPLTDLPPHVRLVTTVSSAARGMAATIQDKLDPGRCARLDPMPADEAGQLLALWLADARRTLQPRQREALMTGFSRSGLPLYLRFAFEESRLWRSFDEVPVLDADVLAIIRQTFARLSDPANHGYTLVQGSMGCLTAAKEGLTEEEMVDLLSADNEVMADFRFRFPKSPMADRLPLVIWSRLYYELRPYLAERGGQGSAVLNYFHRQMRQVATADYLDPSSEVRRHRALAGYFRAKPNVLGATVYNARKLSELPYQLRKAGMWEELEATLCDLAFIEAKCGAGLIYDLIADYDAAILTAGLPGPAKERIESFSRFVRAQAHLLSTHPHLTFQQALNEPDSTAPARSAARLANSDERPRFRRLGKSQQTSPCMLTLYGHTSYVNACDVSFDGTRIASASSDGEIKIWHAMTGQETLALRGPLVSAESCHFSSDATRLVSGTRSGLVMMWDATSGGELWSIKVHDRPVPCCRFSHDGRRVVSASWDGRIALLDADTGAVVWTVTGHSGDACWAEFSTDDAGIISAGGDGQLKWWSAATGQELRSVKKAHEHEIMTCRFSRDGASIFTASQDMLVKRWDAASLELRATYEGHTAGVWAAAVSPDGRLLATGAGDGSIKLWEVDSGIELASMKEHTNEVWGLTFFDDGSRFVSAAWDGTVKVWDSNTAKQFARDAKRDLGSTGVNRLWGYMIACCCAPDGTLFAAGSQDGSLRLWDASTGLAVGVFPLHRDFVFACAFSPDSRWIVSGAWDGALKIFDVRERRESASESMPGTVVSCAFTNDGRRVVACSTREIRVWDFDAGRLEARVAWKADEAFIGCAAMPGTDRLIAGLESGRFVLWDIATEQPITELAGHRGLIMFSLSRDGRLLAATSEQGAVWIWDVQERKELMTLHGHRERVVACNFSPDGTRIVTGSWDATVRSWDVGSPGEAIVFEGHTDQLQDCCFTPDGTRVLSAAVDGSVRLWDARSGTALGELLWAADSASLCAFAADGRFVVTASCRHGIKVWDGDTGEPMRVLSGHQEAVRACTFLPDGRLLSASADGTLRIWAMERDEAASIAGTHRGPVGTCAISPDGAWIASGGQDRCVRLWDTQTGASLATLEGHDDWVRRVLIVANGSRIVSCSLDHTVRVWDSATRQVLHVLRGHRAALSAVAVSADGSQLLTGDESGMLYVWDLATGNRQLMLSGHRGAITACAFPGRIVSASRDGTLRLWDAATGDTMAELTGHTGPVLACVVSTDRRYVVSASEDKFVKVWNLADGQQRGEYWVGAAALSVSWHPTRQRIAVGDAMGALHLLEFEEAAIR